VTFKNTALANGDVTAAELTFEMDLHMYSMVVGDSMLHTNAASPAGLLTGNGAKNFHVFLLWANKDSTTYDVNVANQNGNKGKAYDGVYQNLHMTTTMGTPDTLTVTWTAATDLFDICTDTVDSINPVDLGTQWYKDTVTASPNFNNVAGLNDIVAITTDAEDQCVEKWTIGTNAVACARVKNSFKRKFKTDAAGGDNSKVGDVQF